MRTFSTTDSTVNSLYLAFYGRPADPAGLKFWSQALDANNGDAGSIIGAFATSQEAQTRFSSDTASARITDIYEQLFNRAPDAAGLDFWTKAVEQGNATLAEVSLAILKGAQSSDLDLSTLRQKAADAFTAAVEDGATEYSGYASIEAARVLVRAVTADATDADLATLVKAAVSFADTATKTPKVVEAIATGSTLLNLYDSARGLKDPVALTQALADTAKAAAGDPVTLESLLRGGGMDKVLKVMPTKATLIDVVEALAKGGLPAAVEVVYPTAPVVVPTPKPVPVPEKTFFFDHMEHIVALSGTATDDVVVNLTKDVILRAGHDPILDMNDIQSVLAKDYAGKVTVIGKAAEIYVAMGDAPVSGVKGYEIIDVKSAIFTGEPGARVFLSPRMESLLASVSSVKLSGVLSMEERELFNNLRGFDTAKLFAEVDNIAPAMPTIALVKDDGFDPTDGLTSVAKLAINGLDKSGGAVWQYSIDNGTTWQNGGTYDDSGKAELDLSDMHFEGTRIQVRQIDAAGNLSLVSNEVTFTIVPGLEQPTDPNPSTDPSDSGDSGDSGLPSNPTNPTDPNMPATEAPYVNTVMKLDGVQVNTNIVGQLESTSVNGSLVPVLTRDGNSTAHPGGVMLGAQQSVVSGVITVKNAQGNLTDNVNYTLGTNSGDGDLHGQNVWGFDGDDYITGTEADDLLVGGKGADWIDLGFGGNDTVVIGQGDTATNVSMIDVDTVSMAGMDVIANASVGDTIRVYAFFTESRFENTFLTDGGTHKLALLQGRVFEETFVIENSDYATSYLLQWSDGDNVNSVVLESFGHDAPMLQVDDMGTITVIGVNQGESQVIPGG
jgi:hypothetical protein